MSWPAPIVDLQGHVHSCFYPGIILFSICAFNPATWALKRSPFGSCECALLWVLDYVKGKPLARASIRLGELYHGPIMNMMSANEDLLWVVAIVECRAATVAKIKLGLSA